MAYAHICLDLHCHHLATDHRLAPEGDLVAGPYLCSQCDCEVPQAGPFGPLTRREFEERFPDHAAVTRA